MKKSARIAGFIFIALSLIDVIPLCFGVESIHPCVKPFLILSLLAAALLALLPEHKGRQTVLLAVGMALHATGDILLMFDSKGFVWFAAGLGAFLLGHFCYIAVLLHKMGGLRGWYEIFTWVVPLLMVYPLLSFFEVEGVLLRRRTKRRGRRGWAVRRCRGFPSNRAARPSCASIPRGSRNAPAGRHRDLPRTR